MNNIQKYRAAPRNLASRFGERFFVKARLEKRRNTVCISSFSNYRIGGKDPAKREDAIVRCCHSLLLCYRMTKVYRKAQKVIAFLSIF